MTKIRRFNGVAPAASAWRGARTAPTSPGIPRRALSDNDQWKKYEWEGGCEDLHIVEDESGTGLHELHDLEWAQR